MKRERVITGFLRVTFLSCAIFFMAGSAKAVDIATDVADPLYMERLGDFTMRTSADVGDFFQLREVASYGFSNKFSMAGDVRYRNGTDNKTDGFSNIGLMGTYRVGQGNTGLTDVLFGFGFGGQGVVPNYSDEVYSVGVKTGKQWPAMTLSGTVMTNWIFDDENGIAYVDFIPEAYLRMHGDWSLGLGMTFRKSTTAVLDQEWINTKIGTTIGKTGWFLNTGYEFESQDFRIGGSLNMLF
jgi:hypothetical protein